MTQVLRALVRVLPLSAALGISFALVSCAVPPAHNSTLSASGSSTGSLAMPYSMRQKYGGGRWFPEVEETTRENFFAWLLDLEGDSDEETSKKESTTPARPTVPAPKVNSGVLAQSNKSNTRIVVDISQQKAFLLVDGKIAIESPVSTARTGKYTPRGNFQITQRVRSGKISTIYGVHMPYWMRLSGSVYGVHAGYLPGYPASAGCIRLPSAAAQMIYDNTKYGTQVSIYSSWNGA